MKIIVESKKTKKTGVMHCGCGIHKRGTVVM